MYERREEKEEKKTRSLKSMSNAVPCLVCIMMSEGWDIMSLHIAFVSCRASQGWSRIQPLRKNSGTGQVHASRLRHGEVDNRASEYD